MPAFTIWNVQSIVTCKSKRWVPLRKSVYFGISKFKLYFRYNFHVQCILPFTMYFHVPCTVHFTVYFHTVTSMFLFLCYWFHSKLKAVNQTIQLCFYQRYTIGQSFKGTSCNGWKWIAVWHITIVTFSIWGLFWRRCS